MTSSDIFRQPAFEPPALDEHDTRVDAIRYAILRKLAPGLQHALMGELQAIQLSVEFAARALGSDAEARASLESLPLRCADAVKTGRSLVEWLRPEPAAATSLRDGIGTCLKLVGEDWFLRGNEATTDLPDGDVQVPRAALRELAVATLLILSDMHDQPADFHVAAQVGRDLVDVAFQAHPAQRVASIAPTGPYRKLVWADLKLLAGTYGVPCHCEGRTAALQFARITGL